MSAAARGSRKKKATSAQLNLPVEWSLKVSKWHLIMRNTFILFIVVLLAQLRYYLLEKSIAKL
jgi:hypothetical protein